MRIIPAIDLINGACVRLHQGDYAQQTTYNSNPVEVATQFADAGLEYLHVVDLDGAKAGTTKQLKTIEAIVKATSMKVDVGGGITSIAIAKKVLATGVAQINIGSLAIKQPNIFIDMLQTFGAEKIILSADVLDEIIKISGWQVDGSLSIYQAIEQYMPHGLQYVCCTDISKDGTLQGPSIPLYKKILEKYPAIKLIASGGIGSINDVHALNAMPFDGAIIGKAIYENKISLQELTTI
jgi:phosphoribosylformimino-5-aminoimidazole carboxamide ribotide isomerase